MLTAKVVYDSGGAAHYFESADDYYDKGQNGEWQGKGADALGLLGKVDREQFRTLLDGVLPDGTSTRKFKPKAASGKQPKERKGIDFTFSAPKSVSIQALMVGDARLIEAHDRAVKEAIAELEKLAYSRRKEKGVSMRENTGNLIVASFRHELSRAQDPQLHTHNIVMNLTQRGDGQFRALKNEQMLHNIKRVGGFYRMRLAEHIRALGYELREGPKGGWELAHIDRSVIEAFSKRSKEIEQLLTAIGRDRDDATTGQKQMMTLASRVKKTEEDRAALRDAWRETARSVGFDPTRATTVIDAIGRELNKLTTNLTKRANVDGLAADGAIDFAIAHLQERQGIFSQTELRQAAYERGATTTTVEAIDAAMLRAVGDGRLVQELPLLRSARSLDAEVRAQMQNPLDAAFMHRNELEQFTQQTWVALTMERRGVSEQEATTSVREAITRGALVLSDPRYTTRAAQDIERAVLAAARDGIGKVAAITSRENAAALIAGTALDAEQKHAANFFLTSTDRFVALKGYAGTGKSRLLAETANALAKSAEAKSNAPYTLLAIAPYTQQVRALEELGWRGDTVQGLLQSKAKQRAINDKTVVYLDEASVVPAWQMRDVMRLIESKNARLIIGGDRKQTAAIEAGKPFVQLLNNGIPQVELTDIKRQQDLRLRGAVSLAANDKINESLAMLTPDIVQIPPAEKRYAAIAKAYAALTSDERDKTIIVAGTNAARQAINTEIRPLLNVPTATQVTALQSIDHTRAELAHASTYIPGQLVISARREHGLEKDQPYRVLAVSPKENTITLLSEKRETITINPTGVRALSLYEEYALPVGIGDKLKITRNNRELGAVNGARYNVTGVDPHGITLTNNHHTITLPRTGHMHLQHAYATTIHSAQGTTQDRVLIDADTRSLTSNKSTYYVAISRERHKLTIYTDDANRLGKAMSREPKKFAALELRDPKAETHFANIKMSRVPSPVPRR
jgi:conjugative relaxase-like TrwC/TraI family protein